MRSQILLDFLVGTEIFPEAQRRVSQKCSEKLEE
jgi:hypothetical protein